MSPKSSTGLSNHHNRQGNGGGTLKGKNSGKITFDLGDEVEDTKNRGRRVLCFGTCVTGPRQGQWGALSILALIILGSVGSIYFTFLEIFEQEDTSVALVLLFSFSSFFGVWTVLAQLCVQFSDPGILTNHSGNPGAEDDDFRAQCLDLEDGERAVFENDPIYQSSTYYQFRSCETCMLTRTPKASHCGQCGHCVQGWDHHCVALNNCVGVRNMRGFVTFLIVSFIFALLIALSCLMILFISRDYAESTPESKVGVGVGLVIALVTFILTVKPWFKNTCRFVTALTGMILAIASSMLYCRQAPSFIAALGIYIAIGYCLIIRHMLMEYLELVSLHLTTKEKNARIQCAKERCIDKSSDFKQ